MRRITVWITTTLTTVALVIAYQLNQTGAGTKGGDVRDDPSPVTTSSSGSSSALSPGSPKSGDAGSNTQTGKPGERK
jgi:hypothetical protein